MISFIEIFNFVLLLLFSGCYAYQLVYLLIGLFKKDKLPAGSAPLHRFCRADSCQK